jgi:DNA-binding NarL/FixJ family response regulator
MNNQLKVSDDQALRMIIADVLGISPHKVWAGASLVADLHATSLDFMEMVVGVEEASILRFTTVKPPNWSLLLISKDLQKLLASGLDACIPMFASPRTLIDTLQLIVCERLRVLIVSDSTIPDALIDPEEDEDDEVMQEPPLVKSLTSPFLVPVMPSTHTWLAKDAGDSAAGGDGLSEREEKILKALIHGHSNKVIACMNSITEATVKVKMRSILRKIQVANRTQAAIWAIKNTDFADEVS